MPHVTSKVYFICYNELVYKLITNYKYKIHFSGFLRKAVIL